MVSIVFLQETNECTITINAGYYSFMGLLFDTVSNGLILHVSTC